MTSHTAPGPSTTDPAPPLRSDVAPERRRRLRKSLLASTTGQLFEWYEWSVYAVFAPFIAAAMFDGSDPVSALLSTLAVFAVGFLVRPLGGIFFGRIADKRGRKYVLIITMLMMAAASLAIGLLPTYATLGAGASALLLLMRVIQGFAHGGESATANSYVSEIAPQGRRGLWGSVVFISIMGGSVIAYAIGGGLTAVMSESAVAEWGWRVPFLLGAVFAVVVLYLRKGMEESDVFHTENENEDAEPASASPEQPRPRTSRAILLLVAMISGITVAHYTWSSYASTFAITQHDMVPSHAYWAITAAQVIALITLPLWGMLSDRIGRRPLMIGFAIATIATTIPLKAMITGNPWSLFIASTIALVIVAAAGSILAATMAEAFPTRMRTQGIGFAYSFAVAAFGGSAPYLNALFIDLNMAWMSSAYIMTLCVFTIIASVVMKETRGIDLRNA